MIHSRLYSANEFSLHTIHSTEPYPSKTRTLVGPPPVKLSAAKCICASLSRNELWRNTTLTFAQSLRFLAGKDNWEVTLSELPCLRSKNQSHISSHNRLHPSQLTWIGPKTNAPALWLALLRFSSWTSPQHLYKSVSTIFSRFTLLML